MKFEVVKEVSYNEGKKDIWYLVEPKCWFFKIFNYFLEYSPHQNKEQAILEAKLKSKKKWNGVISKTKLNED